MLYEELSFKIIGAAMDVHKELGCGFLEPIYQEALAIEFEQRGINFEREKEMSVTYKDKILNKKYKVDFLCFDDIIVELKAVSEICSVHRAQVINYLNASKKDIGLLINFGENSLSFERLYRHKNIE